jgi:hypothetical protein
MVRMLSVVIMSKFEAVSTEDVHILMITMEHSAILLEWGTLITQDKPNRNALYNPNRNSSLSAANAC